MAERARILAIQNPGRMALVEDASITMRELLAGADAAIFTAAEDLTGRAAGLALRYGALPLAPDAGAFGDFLIDYDAGSATGTALLYAAGDAFELTGTLRRAIALRTDRERWDALLIAMLSSAPAWATTAARLESLAEEAAKEAPTPLLA
jgi:glycogen synthase